MSPAYDPPEVLVPVHTEAPTYEDVPVSVTGIPQLDLVHTTTLSPLFVAEQSTFAPAISTTGVKVSKLILVVSDLQVMYEF